jgi:chromosome segregation ATPase
MTLCELAVCLQSERIMQQQIEITEAQEKLQSLEASNSKLEGELEALKQMIEMKKAEAERETQRRERLEKESRELKSAIGACTSELKQKSVQLKGAEEQQVQQALLPMLPACCSALLEPCCQLVAALHVEPCVAAGQQH